MPKDFFKRRPVRLLRPYHREEEGDCYYKAGEKHDVICTPNGCTHLLEWFDDKSVGSGTALGLDPKEGVDFEFVQEKN